MDMKIAGSGLICSGEYDKISISGSAKSEGRILCREFHCSGAFSGNSDIECTENIHASGAFSNSGNLKASEIHVSGALKISGNCISDKEARISGGFKCEGNLKACELKVSGGLSVGKDLEAENAYITGGISCGGLINAEELRIELSNSHGSRAESIGGSKIIIENYRTKGLIDKIFGRSTCAFVVSDSIEGDEIIIEHTKAKTVTGRYVMIGECCEIDLVQYTENAEISPKAKVKKCEKI